MPEPLLSYKDIQPGDCYEDCAYHPCLCTQVNPGDDEILGISLVDGSFPRACSITHCRPKLLTLEEAITWKLKGPPEHNISEDKRWWMQIN